MHVRTGCLCMYFIMLFGDRGSQLGTFMHLSDACQFDTTNASHVLLMIWMLRLLFLDVCSP